MPNWCYNRVRIDADSDQVEQLKEIYEIFENHSDPFNPVSYTHLTLPTNA